MKKCKLTISRVNSTDPNYHNNIHITLEDEHYDKLFDVYIKPEQFSNAITGVACQECEVEM